MTEYLRNLKITERRDTERRDTERRHPAHRTQRHRTQTPSTPHRTQTPSKRTERRHPDTETQTPSKHTPKRTKPKTETDETRNADPPCQTQTPSRAQGGLSDTTTERIVQGQGRRAAGALYGETGASCCCGGDASVAGSARYLQFRFGVSLRCFKTAMWCFSRIRTCRKRMPKRQAGQSVSVQAFAF